MSLEGSTPSPSACTCPWPIGRGTSLPSWTGGFDSRRALWFVRGWANGTLPGFEPGDEGSIPSPRASTRGRTYRGHSCHRQLLRGRLTAGWDALNVSVLVRFQPPQPATSNETEVIRLDEEPVLKTGGGTDRLWVRVGYRRAAWVASADRRHSTRPWCNGSTTGSNPVGQGSSPWGRALGEPSLIVRAHGPTGRRQLRKLEIRVRLPVGPLITQRGPVA